MFNTMRIRIAVAAAWLVLVGSLWWGYGKLMTRYTLQEPMNTMEAALDRQDWAAVQAANHTLTSRWQAARPVVELNFGGGLLETFETILARLEGSIAAGDAAAVRIYLAELRVDWQALQSPYPDGK